MQLKLFIVPVKNVSAAEAEMNAFLRVNRVLAVKKEFVPDGEIFVETNTGKLACDKVLK